MGRPKGRFLQPSGQKHKGRDEGRTQTAVQGLDLRYISKEEAFQEHKLVAGWLHLFPP